MRTKLGLLPQVRNALGADIAHAAAQAAHQLEDEVLEEALVGNLALDAFGHRLAADVRATRCRSALSGSGRRPGPSWRPGCPCRDIP